jgi:hypothetical protein
VVSGYKVWEKRLITAIGYLYNLKNLGEGVILSITESQNDVILDKKEDVYKDSLV